MTTPPQPPPPGWQPPPPGYYPPPGPPGYYPPMPRPAKKPSYWASPGGLFIIILGSVAFCGVLFTLLIWSMRASDRGSDVAPLNAADLEVRVVSCTVSGSDATIGYSVTNNGDRAQRVTLEVEYRDSAGARLDTDTSYVGEVPAGDTVRGEESTNLNAEPGGNITCRVVGAS